MSSGRGIAPVFTPDETDGLRLLFGRGPDGARHLLRRLDGGVVRLPDGVNLATLRRYRGVAQDAIDEGKDRIGVQALRLQAIRRLMGED